MNHPSGIVFSTGQGRMCPSCGRPAADCVCGREKSVPAGDGVVRVRREIKGRGGKTVTLIYGLAMGEKQLGELAGEMKRRFGTGGSVKEGSILIQGDRCNAVMEWLGQKGFKVKRSGG